MANRTNSVRNSQQGVLIVLPYSAQLISWTNKIHGLEILVHGPFSAVETASELF